MIRYASLVLTSVLLASGIAGAHVASSPHRPPTVKHQGWMSKDANPAHAWLYVASYSNNTIEIYDVEKFASKKIGEITEGINQPAGISVDGAGTLYVSTQVGQVQIYSAGSTTPTLTLSQGLTQANDVVTDANGNVYVANSGGSVPNIVVYPPGQTTPSEAITSSLLSRPYGEAFDSQGNLYISDWNLGVCMVPSGSQQVVSLGLQGGGQPAGIAVAPTTNNLFVNYYYGATYKTLVYAAGSPVPIRALQGTEGANDIAIGTLRHATYAFVPDWFTNSIYVYKPSAKRPRTVIVSKARNINGVALKPAGVP